MGNLLGSPITEKHTQIGETNDVENKLKYGLSTMQGWRVHMEDAHIAEVDLYALETEKNHDQLKKTTTKIPLKGHSLFAVYDGHGGTFAAIYSGNNFLRILSKQQNFIEYAKLCEIENNEEEKEQEKEKQKNKKSKNNNDDEEYKNATTTSTSTGTSTTKNREAKKLDLLDKAFKQAFVETDYEIGLAVRGKAHPDANSLYHPEAAAADSKAAVSTASTANNNNNNNNNNAGVAAVAYSDQKSAIEDDGDSGTTACVVMITPSSIICANAGDSRAVFARRTQDILPDDAAAVESSESSPASDSAVPKNNTSTSNSNKAIPLSYDHKPEDDDETRRIRAAGGYVANGRVEGDLAVSRGLGDFRFKQMAIVLNNTQLFPEDNGDQHMTTDDELDDSDDDGNNNSQQQVLMQPGTQKVSPIPDFIVHTRQPEKDEYIIVACDGIWDVVNNQQCIHDVDNIMYIEGEHDLGLISEEILDSCLLYGSKDNMTAIVIQLPACGKSYELAKAAATHIWKQPQDGVLGRRRVRDHEHNNSHENNNNGNNNNGNNNDNNNNNTNNNTNEAGGNDNNNNNVNATAANDGNQHDENDYT